MFFLVAKPLLRRSTYCTACMSLYLVTTLLLLLHHALKTTTLFITFHCVAKYLGESGVRTRSALYWLVELIISMQNKSHYSLDLTVYIESDVFYDLIDTFCRGGWFLLRWITKVTGLALPAVCNSLRSVFGHLRESVAKKWFSDSTVIQICTNLHKSAQIHTNPHKSHLLQS